MKINDCDRNFFIFPIECLLNHVRYDVPEKYYMKVGKKEDARLGI